MSCSLSSDYNLETSLRRRVVRDTDGDGDCDGDGDGEVVLKVMVMLTVVCS